MQTLAHIFFHERGYHLFDMLCDLCQYHAARACLTPGVLVAIERWVSRPLVLRQRSVGHYQVNYEAYLNTIADLSTDLGSIENGPPSIRQALKIIVSGIREEDTGLAIHSERDGELPSSAGSRFGAIGPLW